MRTVLFLALVGSNVIWLASVITWRRRAFLWAGYAAIWEEHTRQAVKDRKEWVDMLLGKLEAYGDSSASELRRMLRDQTAVAPPTKHVN